MAQRVPEIKQDFIKYLGEDYKIDYRLLKAQDFGVPQRNGSRTITHISSLTAPVGIIG